MKANASNTAMRRIGVAVAASSAVAAVAMAASATAAPRCGAAYDVVEGETLSMIALMALGDSARWREIYVHEDNEDAVAADPHTPLQRVRLAIPPCPDYGPLDVGDARAPRSPATPPLANAAAPAQTETAPTVASSTPPATATVSADYVRRAPAPRIAPRAAFALRTERPTTYGPARATSPRPRPASVERAAPAAAPATPIVADAPAPVVARPASSAAQSAVEIEALTGETFAPIVDHDAPGGGLATQIVAASFEASGVGAPFRVDVVGDWSAHMAFLLRDDKFDIGFPWTAPNCDATPTDPETAADLSLRCEYVYSDPFMHVAMEIYGPSDLAEKPRDFAGLRNASICRPLGRTLDDLVAVGLAEAETPEIVRAPSAAACFQMLSRGEVDFVSANRFAAQQAVAELSLSGLVTAYPDLATVQLLRIAAHRDNAEAAGPWIEAFNAGLGELRRTGRWDEIVDWHLERLRSGG